MLAAVLPVALLAAAPFSGRAEAADLPQFQKSAELFNMKCAKCHTIGAGARVGPDLRGVSDRRPKDWLIGFIMNPDSYLESDPAAKKLLQEYNGVRMENAHLTRAQAEGLLDYLEKAAGTPSAAQEAPAVTEDPLYRKLRMPDEGLSVSVFGIFAFLLFLAAAVALWQAGFHSGSATVSVLACLAGYWAFGGRHYHRLLGNQQGYEPVQPLGFSHKLHAGELSISCLYCHHGAEKSDVAGVPAVSVCMNCHVAVRKRSSAKEPSRDIARLVEVWEKRQSAGARPLEWIRVHRLPDYVHFSHRVHVADNIQCQECHGPVQAMARMRQASSLSMGWCIDCHRQSAGAAPTHWKRAGGPLDCAACHW